MASSLLQESRKINSDSNEELATHRAAEADDVRALEELVKKKAPLVTTDTIETPLHVAASKGSVHVIKWLLDNKIASPFEKAKNGNTAAHYAAVCGHLPALKLILTHNPSIKNQLAEQTDESGLTIASLAAVQGDEEMLQWIIEHFPKVASIPNTHGNLPIHFAAASGSVNMLKILVKKCGKAIAESEDAHKTKPVYFAAQEGKMDALNYLINELGVDPVASDEHENCTIHAATQANQLETVQYLVSKFGPGSIVKPTADGATPLHMAAGLGHINVLEYLLSKCESNPEYVNVLDEIHATPAHDAVENGQTAALAVLLKYGADVNMKDTEEKTPIDLATELNNTEILNLLTDFKQNGQAALIKYKRNKAKKDSSVQPPKTRTAKEEAAEVSEAISKSADIVAERHSRLLERQGSLQKMNEEVDESLPQAENDSGEKVNYQYGPMGDIYARPNKKGHKKAKKGHDDVDVLVNRSPEPQEDIDEPLVVKKGKSQDSKQRPLRASAEQGIGVSADTISNYSRPSRVKKHQDTESELSYHSGASSSNSYKHQNMSASQQFPQPYGPYPGYPPMGLPMGLGMGMPFPTKHRSGSSIGSHDGMQAVYPPMPPYGPYGMYPPPPMPGYGGYYPPGQYQPFAPMGFYHPRTTEERMHMAELQKGAIMNRHYPMHGARRQGKKEMSAESQSRLPHPDQDIGYGPTANTTGTTTNDGAHDYDDTEFHPPTPPVTAKDGKEDTINEVVKFDSNFIMVKKDQQGSSVSKVGETTLNPAKHTPLVYDGRYDQFIMNDSEDEVDVPEHCQVAFGAECAAILALACVVSFKGMDKQRSKQKTKQSNDKLNMSSVWDQPPTASSKKANQKGSLSELSNLTPQEFSNTEDSKSSDWSKTTAKHETQPDELAPDSALQPGVQRQGFVSLSKQLGQKVISDSLWARNSSMLNIASTSLAGSRAGSRLSLNQTSDEEDDLSDGNFGDTISIMEGIDPSKTISKKKSDAVQQSQQGDQQGEAQTLESKPVEESKPGKKGKKSTKSKRASKTGKKERKKSTKNAGENQQATTEASVVASDQNADISGSQGAGLVEADGAKSSPKVGTASSSRVELQSGKVMETTQQVSAGLAEIVLISPDGKLSQVTSAGESTPKLEAKAADAATEIKDTGSTKKLSTSAKEGITSSKQETIKSKENTTSAKQDTVPTVNEATSVQTANQKTTKSGPVEVINTFVLDDEEDEDVADMKTPPKPSTMKKAKPQFKDKSQSIEEIMDDLDSYVAEMKDVFNEKEVGASKSIDGVKQPAAVSTTVTSRSSLNQEKAATNSPPIAVNLNNAAVQVTQAQTLAVGTSGATIVDQANSAGNSSNATATVAVQNGSANSDKADSIIEAKPSKLELELLTALNTLQHTVEEIKSNSQLAPHAQQMQHDLIQKIFELNSSPEFIARILSLWSQSQLAQQTSGPLNRSTSHQLITTGLQQRLQEAREQETVQDAMEVRKTAASKKEQSEVLENEHKRALHLNIKEHIDSYLQSMLGKHFHRIVRSERDDVHSKKKRRNQKKHVPSDSESEDEEDDLVTIEATPGTSKPASRTMHAERVQQSLLTEETPQPNPAKRMLSRRGTNMDLHDTKAALHNLTASKSSVEEEEEMKMIIAKPATAQIRRAVIHKQPTLDATDVTPQPGEINRFISVPDSKRRIRS